MNAPDKPRAVISSANPELDGKMGGGIPVGSLVLIEGSSGTGKSVLTQQIVKGSLLDRLKVSMFTTENTVKSLVSQMQSLDMNILDFLLLGKLRIYPVEFSRLGPQAVFQLLDAMQNEQDSDLIIIDSLTSAVTQAGADVHALQFFEACKRMCGGGQTIIITLHANAVAGDLVNPVRSMCDAHLQVRSEQDGQRLVKTLEVAKIRGASSVTGAIVGFDVEPGWGMRVIPISKARG